MKEYSEDPGSKDSGRAYDVTADAPMVEPFKKLSLRLKENEIGVVKTPFGYHVIKRMPPPPPDPLDSADILKREPVTQKAKVKHILLGWTENHTEDPRGTKRSRADLEKLVKDTVAKLKKGDKIEPLMAELCEDGPVVRRHAGCRARRAVQEPVAAPQGRRGRRGQDAVRHPHHPAHRVSAAPRGRLSPARFRGAAPAKRAARPLHCARACGRCCWLS